MRPVLSTTSLRTHPIRDALDAADRLEYAGVEVWAEHLWVQALDPTALGREAARRGLVLTVHGPSRDLNVTSQHPGIREESRRQYARALEDAARLGAVVVTLHPGSLSSSRDAPEAYWPALVEGFAALGAGAARLGLRVGVENMEARPGEFVTSPRQVARLVAEAASPALGLTLDIAHLLANGQPLDLDGLEPLVVHVHLSGSTERLVHVPLDEGIYPLAPPLARLAAFYRGLVAIEGYAPGRELETVAANRRAFDRLLRAARATPP